MGYHLNAEDHDCERYMSKVDNVKEAAYKNQCADCPCPERSVLALLCVRTHASQAHASKQVPHGCHVK